MTGIRERIERGRPVMEHRTASRPLNFDRPKEGLAMNATRVCSYPDCERPHSAKGLCATHYEQARLRGSLNPIRQVILSATPFWDRVNVTPSSDASCWEWIAGTRSSDGRGCLRWNGRTEMAYRVAWMVTYGPIPDGLFVCHSCDNPRCCRPSHLFLGEPKDNTHDMWAKGRGSRAPRYSALGDDHHQTKFTDDEVRRIRERHADGATQVELIQETGMSQSQMSRILNGQSRMGPR